MSRPERPGHQQRILPAHRGQARRLSLQPARRVSRRHAAVPADELPRRVPARCVSARDGRALREAAPAVRGEGAAPADAAMLSAARRSPPRATRQRHSGMHRLPRRGPHRHGARHSRARRPARRRISPRNYALARRQPACGRARLHEADRRRGCRKPTSPQWPRGSRGRSRRRTRRPNRPTSCACRSRAAASDDVRPASRIVIVVVALVVVAARRRVDAAAPGALPQTTSRTPSANRDDAVLDPRRVSRARRRLRRVPHRRRAARQFAGGRAMPTPFGNLYVPNITPDDETGIGQWTADEFYRMMHTGISRDGALLYPAMPFASYTKVTREDCDAIYAYLMSVPPVQPEEPAARAALPLQQARTAGRLARAVLQGRRVRARSAAVGAMEPRRLPRGGPRALRDVPHRHQPARRVERIAGVRRRDDSEPELVRAVADVESRGGPRRLER